MYRPSQTPHLILSSGRIARGPPAARDGAAQAAGPRAGPGGPNRAAAGTRLAPARLGARTAEAPDLPASGTPGSRSSSPSKWRNDQSSGISLAAGAGAARGPRPTGPASHLCCASDVSPQCQTRVKLNRVFFPRCCVQARSPACGFAR